MNNRILSSSEPITLVGGGAVAARDLTDALAYGAKVVAADGGAAHVLAAGLLPDAVIGDFDSIDQGTRAEIPAERLHHISEQDSTDFDKCLRNIEGPLILGVGFLGARIDHALAALNTLVRRDRQRVILIGESEVVFHHPPELMLPLSDGDTVSLMPFAPVTGRSTGLEWPIDGLTLAPGGRIGTSNRATGPVSLSFEGPGMICIIPRERLSLLVAAFQALPPVVPSRVPG